MNTTNPNGVDLLGPLEPGYRGILAPHALSFLVGLHRRFDGRRKALLEDRQKRQADYDAGALPDFPAETADIRASDWTVRAAPPDLRDRRVEITGPVDRKMVVNALNSGARCFMADFEDATSPTWTNVIEGQINLREAIRRQIDFTDEKSGKRYRVNSDAATLIVRPRGLHLEERHMVVNGSPISAALFDFGLYLYHNFDALNVRGSGPYFYLPKLESRFEARFWALVFSHAEEILGMERGTIRCTVLIETLPATFELDEILYELRDYCVGLNCGRWDYIFSYIKRLRGHKDRILPDRSQVNMTVPFMRAYSRRVIGICHRRGAHAMGGMSAFIPVKGDEAANALAFEQVRADKVREATDGHDGCWVAHPDLVPIAKAAFDDVMSGPNQIDEKFHVTGSAADLVAPPEGSVTEVGARENIDVAIRYIAGWLAGRGAAPIRNMMEDAATAEIARAQLWQWRVNGVKTDTDVLLDASWIEEAINIAEAEILEDPDYRLSGPDQVTEAANLLRELVLSDEFAEFLTLKAYDRLTDGLQVSMRLTEFD
ncbi:malate synthase A [Hyphobacterium sp. HN65]|uniref:malate synthase n=1 Tax=Hyphobacterium lacteum TaxID=3116575 RepID=A0ABU7LPE1_9PROT|nr:malate synthase A [Hyphobacterium sp. HN65]MEE2525783.1 malate synthase A [Hyphobacterium sp. HN65]